VSREHLAGAIAVVAAIVLVAAGAGAVVGLLRLVIG
jgi:hypothetical protein